MFASWSLLHISMGVGRVTATTSANVTPTSASTAFCHSERSTRAEIPSSTTMRA
jgi:hypothetical protein